MTTLNAFEICQTCAVDTEQGDLISAAIERYLEGTPATPLEVNFEGVEVFATPFLRHAFAPLVESHNETFLREWVKVVNMPDYARALLHRIITNAQAYTVDSNYRQRVDEMHAASIE